MTAVLYEVTHDQLAERRCAALARLDIRENELRQRAVEHVLTPEERDALTELEEIDFLLGDDGVTIDVQKAVLTFAQEVQDLLDSVLPPPDDVPPEDRQVQVPFIDGRYSVRVAADHARIAENGARVGYLRATFHCTTDLPRGAQVDLRATRIRRQTADRPSGLRA